MLLDELEPLGRAGGGEDAEFVSECFFEVLQRLLFIIDIENGIAFEVILVLHMGKSF